jgi:hypothetical protein
MTVTSSSAPQHRTRNPCQVSHAHGLASSAFARHYSRNHQCFLFLRVLRCFTSPRSPPHPIHSDAGNPTSLGLGFPIRTSSDHSSVDNSPRHIAASHVLHRPLVPRHPPCALHNLATKMLASTIQFSNNTHPRQHTHTPTPQQTRRQTPGMPSQNPTACQHNIQPPPPRQEPDITASVSTNSLSTHSTKTHVPSTADTPHHTPTPTVRVNHKQTCRSCGCGSNAP